MALIRQANFSRKIESVKFCRHENVIVLLVQKPDKYSNAWIVCKNGKINLIKISRTFWLSVEVFNLNRVLVAQNRFLQY